MNGSLEVDQVDEATPLLSFADYRPAILPAVRQYSLARSNGSDTLGLDSHRFPSDAERTAFLLLVHLHYNIQTQEIALNDSKDIWENWQHARVASIVAVDTGRRASETMDQFLSNHNNSSAIQTMFWTVFPLEGTGNVTIRVIDMLTVKHTPSELLTHPIIEAMVMMCWKYGTKADPNHIRGIMGRFDALSTPRVLHLIDILGRLAFMGSLIHYLLYPPRFYITLGHDEQGARELLLTLVSAASLARRWSTHTLPAMLVFPAFILALPSVPLPGTISFSVLHIALLLQLIVLHLPTSPSLPIAMAPKNAIPLSALLLSGASRILMPIILFFLPALLLAAFLVSASLVDTFPSVFPNHLEVSPMDSRFSFFVLFITVITFLMGAFGMIPAMLPNLASSTPSRSGWDRYSREIGLHARRSFVEALVQYEIYHFPVPFNILQLLVRVPCVVFPGLGHTVTPYMKSMEKVLWRVSVGLIGAIVSSLWLWVIN